MVAIFIRAKQACWGIIDVYGMLAQIMGAAALGAVIKMIKLKIN